LKDWPLLAGLTRAELGDLLAELGEPRYRGDQLFEWIHKRLVTSFDKMTNLPRDLRTHLASGAVIDPLSIVRRQVDSTDGTRKDLFRTLDGELLEAVAMTYEHGLSICVSSQIGCRQGCSFCASTIGGLTRNLDAGEIVTQCYAFARESGDAESVHSVVFMGMGEPLENYDNVVKALRILHDPHGLNIGYRRMTISTVGLVPQIDRLSAEGLPVTLAVSLHAPNDQLRSRLMPVNRQYPINELMGACRRFVTKTGRRVSFEYILIKGVNDDESLAQQLSELVVGFLSHINLIPLNPVSERAWERPPGRQVDLFRSKLEEAGIPTTVRRTLGVEIDAACGQLRRRELESPTEPRDKSWYEEGPHAGQCCL